MKTRIYTLLAALLLTVASVQAQTVTTISVKPSLSSIIVGDDVYVVVTLEPEINAIATLTVTNSDNSYNKSFYVALEDGCGSYYVPNLAAGTYSIKASFAGNDQYAASTSETKTIQVNKITTALALSFDDNDIVSTKTIYVGDFTFFKVRLLKDENKEVLSFKAVATVRLTDKDTFDEATDKVYVVGLVNGICNSEEEEEDGNLSPKDYQNALTDFPAGTYKLKATYAGDDRYKECESNVVTLTVSKIATTLTVADITAITTGQDAVITVTATPTDENVAAVNTIATVTVGGTDYKVPIVNGTGTCYVPNLTAGTYNVTASIGDDKYADSSSGTAKTLTVNTGNPIVESNSVATVTVTPAINTVATVTVGDATYYVPVVNGTGTLTLPQQVAGTHNVQAQFIEDGQYAASTSTTQQLVSVTGVTFPFAANQEWATWCDDWAWKKPTGVTAYTISAVSGNTVTITAVEDENIPAYTPLLLKKTGDAVTPTKVITATGTDNLVSATPTGATFYGNASDTMITEGYNYAYGSSYGLYNGEFVLIDTDNGIAANRCLLNVGGTNSAPVLNISEEITSLTPIPSPKGEGREYFYTLDGRKLDKQPTVKGLYILNGKKVVVK